MIPRVFSGLAPAAVENFCITCAKPFRARNHERYCSGVCRWWHLRVGMLRRIQEELEHGNVSAARALVDQLLTDVSGCRP